VGVRLNFVVDARGNWATNTSQRAVAHRLDLKLLNHLRCRSDLIVTGGKTVLAEQYRSSKWAPIAVFSNNPDLVQHSLFRDSDSEHKNLLITSLQKSPAQALRELHSQGFEHILLESGPNLTKELASVIDEVCVTAPNSSIEPDLGFLGFRRKAFLQHSVRVDGLTFMRFICT
jgi:riboflavin biosynthesis pyrimidine reductase